MAIRNADTERNPTRYSLFFRENSKAIRDKAKVARVIVKSVFEAAPTKEPSGRPKLICTNRSHHFDLDERARFRQSSPVNEHFLKWRVL